MTQVAKKGNLEIVKFFNKDTTLEYLSKMIGENKKESFAQNIIAMSESDERLQECSPRDLMICAFNATSLDLPLNKNLGYGYIVAYKGKPQFQIGVRGKRQLALRTNAYKKLDAVVVRKGEIEYNKFTQEYKVLGNNPEGEVVGYLAYMVLLSGYEASVYMTVEEMDAHASRYSQTYKNDKKYNSKKSLWSDPVEKHKMGCKTVMGKLLDNNGIMSTTVLEATASPLDNVIDVPYEDIPQADVTYTQQVAPQTDPTQQQAPKKMKLSDA